MPTRRTRWAWRAPLLLALFTLSPAQAGLLEGEPYASVSVEHDDNLFRFSDDAEALALSGGTERADTYRRLALGAGLRYSWGLQRVLAGGELRRYNYSRFKQLDRNGHEFGGELLWRIASPLSGNLRYRQSRDSESFIDRDTTLLGFKTQREAETRARLEITPHWHLLGSLRGLRQRYTQAVAQNFELDEDGGSLGVDYLGAPLSQAGAAVEVTRGDYPSRDPATLNPGVATAYEQTDFKLRAGYSPSGISSLRAEAGYTRRDNRGNGAEDFSGVTGQASYEREFSALTSLRAELFRQLRQVEEVDANFVRQDSAALVFDWQLTQLMKLSARGELSRELYQGAAAVAAASGEERRDTVRIASLELRYKPFFWLTLTPALRQESRDSNRADRGYESTVFGLEIEARYD